MFSIELFHALWQIKSVPLRRDEELPVLGSVSFPQQRFQSEALEPRMETMQASFDALDLEADFLVSRNGEQGFLSFPLL